MDSREAEQGVAELERQLAQQKRVAELERQLAEAKGLVSGGEAVERPAEVSAARLAAIEEHASRLAQALRTERGNPFAPGLPPVREALLRAAVDAGLSQRWQASMATRRKRAGTDWIGPTALIPSTALWMSPIVCRSGYDMASTRRTTATNRDSRAPS
jgi:hypothetical protein